MTFKRIPSLEANSLEGFGKELELQFAVW